MTPKPYPVLMLCGSDRKRRKLLQELDPDYQLKSKALLPFLGKRVIDWQIEALQASPYVKDLYLLGLTEEDAQFQPPVHYVPVDPTSSIDEKLITGLDYLTEQGEDTRTIIVTTSDTPGLLTESINTFFEALEELEGPYDGVLTGVPIEVTRQEFPDNNRVVFRFRDHHIFPGEMAALSGNAIRTAQPLIEDIGVLRRSFNREDGDISVGPALRYIGRKPGLWWMILRYVLGLVSVRDAETALSRAFNLRLKMVVIEDPGFGMDMDLPEDYHRLEEYIRKTKPGLS